MTTDVQSVAASPEQRSLTWSRVGWLASIVFFGVLPALLFVLLASDVRGETIAIDFRQFYGAAEAILDGREPLSAERGANDHVGRPVPVSAASGAACDPADSAPDPGRGRARHGHACGRRVRRALRARCPGLALLRRRADVASGDLRRPNGEPYALARARRGARVALSRSARSALGEHRDHARGQVLPLAARRLARRDPSCMRPRC